MGFVCIQCMLSLLIKGCGSAGKLAHPLKLCILYMFCWQDVSGGKPHGDKTGETRSSYLFLGLVGSKRLK